MICLYYVIPETDSFPNSVAKHFCDQPLHKYLDPKTVLIYCPHPVHKVEQLVQGVDWSETGLKTEDGEAWGAEYDEPADLTTTRQVVNIHKVEQ
jgi:hypothetical protein